MNGKNALALGATAVAFLNIGAAVGYFVAKEKLGKEFDERLKTEVASTKKFYSRLHKRDENDMPSIVETDDMLPVEREAAQAMQRYQGNNTVIDTPREEPVYETATTHTGEAIESNVFDAGLDVSVEEYEALIRNRTEEAPYIITLAEFLNNELEHEQDTLVYFQEDGILVDNQDEVVADPDSIVGDDNLVRFGHFSGDMRKVYVRNEILTHDFEITSHEGRYSFVVLGLEPENAEV